MILMLNLALMKKFWSRMMIDFYSDFKECSSIMNIILTFIRHIVGSGFR